MLSSTISGYTSHLTNLTLGVYDHFNWPVIHGVIRSRLLQALTLSFCTQWPIGLVDVKSYWPEIFVIYLKKQFFVIHRPSSKYASLAIGDLLSCFQLVSIAAGIV